MRPADYGDGTRAAGESVSAPAGAPSCCLMILNYNGKRLLAQCLPSALRAANRLGRPCPVVVVDNCSTAGDVEYVEKNFPKVEVFSAKENDYLFSLNDAVASRSEDVVIILNNDVVLDKGFVAPLLRHFAKPEIFAASAKIFHADQDVVITARSFLVYRDGWYTFSRTYDDMVPCYSFYAAGGAGAFRRSMFLALDGFDTLFRPGYSEEVDLSYRAWRRGWKVVYEPGSHVEHQRSASFGKAFTKAQLRRIVYRNRILFNVKDCGGMGFVLGFVLRLPWSILRGLAFGDRVLALGALESLPRLPLALWRRFRKRHQFRVSERVLMDEIRQGRYEAPHEEP